MNISHSKSAAALMAGTLSLLLPSLAAAQAAPQTVVLNVEGEGVDAQTSGALTSVTMAALRAAPEYEVVERPRANLSDIALVIGCDAQRPDCLLSIAEQFDTTVLAYGSARSESGGTRVKFEVFDTRSRKVVHRVQKVVPVGQDVVGTWRVELDGYFNSARQADKAATLVISSNVRGATGQLNGEPVGSTPFERAGIQPGTYKVTVSRDGFVDWNMVAAISEGATLKLRAELKRDGVVVKPPTPDEPKEDPKTDPKEDPKGRDPLVVKTPGGNNRDPSQTIRPSDQNDSLNWGGWGLVGVGGAALLGSGVAAFFMESTETELREMYDNRTLTESERQRLTQRGESYELTHWILLGVGGVGVASGLIWVAVDAATGPNETDGASFMLAPTPGGVAASASWRF